MKYPIMPMWVGDITADTQEMTSTEFGVYVRLLFQQWKKGSIPADPSRLEVIAPGALIVWDSIKENFVPDPTDSNRLINLKCHEIKLEVVDKASYKTDIAKRAAWERWHPGEAYPDE